MDEHRHARAITDIGAILTALPPGTIEHEALAMRWGLSRHERPPTEEEIADSPGILKAQVVAILR